MAREFDTLNVEIEPGMPGGHELLFFEEGEPVIDGEPGDLRMKIVTATDETFRRDGNDLYMTYWIDLVDALTGFSKEFEHFDGHKVGIGQDGTTAHATFTLTRYILSRLYSCLFHSHSPPPHNV